MSTFGHLVRRFFGSLRPGGPSAEDRIWVHSQLLSGEAAIWNDMSAADRRHSAGVARRVVGRLGDDATRPVVAAALLHDCGKVRSGLGTFGRVGATIAGASVMRTEEDRTRWERSGSQWRRSVALYRRHPELGAEMLREAGSDPLTIAWTREHHRPSAQWTVPMQVAVALHEADDD